ncbi:hypothetical protein KY335_00245 [Candidatus Woesearchaeota archaeon]|nr:hypothetical protein [Candidatus Woesearchaeota archaeon]MBW3013653.1 hypothetical protein [Candidatus Woesearchaeota archaeon]
MEKYGHYAFLVCILLAIIAGLVVVPYTAIILVILGLVVGLLNITAKESKDFLIAAIALAVVGSSGLGVIQWAGLGGMLTTILGNIALFVIPAALVVALKEVYRLARD